MLIFKLGGGTSREIAAELEVSHVTVLKDLKALFKRLADDKLEQTEELRDLENARLDALAVGIWPKAVQGHPDSIRTALSIMERRARLNGLDQPVKVDVTAAVSQELGKALEKLEQAFDDDTFKRILETVMG